MGFDLVDRAGFEPAAFRILGREPSTETTCRADDLQPAYNDTLYTRLIYRPTMSAADAEGWLNWFWHSADPTRWNQSPFSREVSGQSLSNAWLQKQAGLVFSTATPLLGSCLRILQLPERRRLALLQRPRIFRPELFQRPSQCSA